MTSHESDDSFESNSDRIFASTGWRRNQARCGWHYSYNFDRFVAMLPRAFQNYDLYLKALEGFSDGELPQVFRRTRLEHRILGYDMRAYTWTNRGGVSDYLVVLLPVSRSDPRRDQHIGRHFVGVPSLGQLCHVHLGYF
jgi:hypothetical protein